MAGICPKCDQTIMLTLVVPMIKEELLSDGPDLVSYNCPECGVILSVGPNIDEMENRIISATAAAVMRQIGELD